MIKIKNFFQGIERFCDSIYTWFMNFFKKYYLLISLVAVFIISLIIRICFLDYLSGDMNGALLPWFNYLKNNGHFLALKTYPNWEGIRCDYPVGYLNILAILSYLPGKGIHLIKYSSFFFDYALAFAGFLIIKQITKNKFIWFITSSVLMLFPTGILNSALWGQCDQLYTCAILFSIYFIIKNRPNIAMIFLGLGLSCKLQATFFLPVLIYLWINKKFKLRHFITLFLTVFASFLPSYFVGAPFAMPFEMFVTQMTSLYANANYGAGSMYAFFEFSSLTNGINNGAGVLFALLIFGLTIVLLHHYKIEYTIENFIYVSTLFSLICPFVLPHMHERYFFFADVMMIIYVIVFKRKYILAILMSFSSILAYTHFLMGGYIIKFLDTDCVRLAALINLSIIITLIYDAKKLKKGNSIELA